MKKALIVGCGYVGTKLAKNLFAAGISVTGVRRDTSVLPQEVQGISHDVSQPTSLVLPKDTDTVFYCVAPSEHSEKAYRETYISGLQNTLRTCEAAKISRFIFVSSSAVYHQNDGSWVEETSSTQPIEFNGKVMLEAESLVQAAKLKSVCVRFSGIYGPGRTHFIEAVKTGKHGLIGTEHYSNRTHRDDCAGILQHVATISAPQALYLGSDNEPTLWDEFVNYLATKLGVIASKSLLHPRSNSKRCLNDRITRSGYIFKYPTYREGYEALLKGQSTSK